MPFSARFTAPQPSIAFDLSKAGCALAGRYGACLHRWMEEGCAILFRPVMDPQALAFHANSGLSYQIFPMMQAVSGRRLLPANPS